MTEHTPGPWTRSQWSAASREDICGNDHKRTKICTMRGHPRANADGRLIASAPDLLAALEEINAAQPPRKANGYDDYKRFYFFAKGRSRAAIAKAKGQ